MTEGGKSVKKRILGLFSLCMLLFLLTGQTAFAALPKMNASVTKKNVMALMDKYDKDAAYILDTMSKKGDNILKWWTKGFDSLTDGIDTAVHEEFHGYSYLKGSWNSENIYTGNKKGITVTYTKVFRSKNMAQTIPSKLRTFRWSTYVGHPVANLGSDVEGVYGLLNEFTAYYWGMHAQMSLFDYFKKNNASSSQWLAYINKCANDRLAYSEFKYYMLQYLVYAKQHSRSVYDGIVKNKSFVKAYTTIEKKFASQIAKFEKQMKSIAKILEKDGHSVSIGDYYRIDGYGTGIFQDD